MSGEDVQAEVIRMIDAMFLCEDAQDTEGATRWNDAVMAFTKRERDAGYNPGLAYASALVLRKMDKQGDRGPKMV